MPEPRLRWQCRRGMRELDELLTKWLETCFDTAPPAEQDAFRRLLALADDELIGYLLEGRTVTDPVLARVVGGIRLRTQNR